MAKKSSAVVLPNLGLYYDRPRIALAPRMLADGLNFRVKQGRISNLNLGWQRFGTIQLNGPVLMIADFVMRGGTEKLVFATDKDLYQRVDDNTVAFISPIYDEGTVERSGTTVTLTDGTFVTNKVKSGDQIHFGNTGETDPAATWHDITVVTNETTLTTADSGTVAPGTAYTIRKRFTGDIQNVWQYAIFVNAQPSGDDELWMTNGLDPIVRWNGEDDTAEQMNSLGFTAKAITVYSNMMIFANLQQSGTAKPTDMINSNPGEPQNVTTGLSEQFKVHGHVDPITRVIPLGQNLVFYSYRHDGAVTIAQFVGDPLVFSFLQITNDVGPVAPRAFADFGNYHEFIARDTQYYFDGATVKPVNNHVWREILRTQDPGRIAISYSHFDPENGDLIWSLPTTADPDPNAGPAYAYAEHYLEDPGPNLPTPFSKREFPFTSTGYFQREVGLTWDQLTDKWSNYSFRWNDRFFFASFPLNLGGTADGKLYSFNSVQDADGAPLNSFFRFGRRALFDGRVRGLLTRIYPMVHTFSTPISVNVQMMDSADAEPAIVDAESFPQTLEEGKHFTVHYRRGRFFEVEFSTSGINQPFEFSGYDVDIRPGGRR